jgi:hypothetical protein
VAVLAERARIQMGLSNRSRENCAGHIQGFRTEGRHGNEEEGQEAKVDHFSECFVNVELGVIEH